MLCLARDKSSDSFLIELIETNGQNGIQISLFQEEWETLIESLNKFESNFSISFRFLKWRVVSTRKEEERYEISFFFCSRTSTILRCDYISRLPLCFFLLFYFFFLKNTTVLIHAGL